MLVLGDVLFGLGSYSSCMLHVCLALSAKTALVCVHAKLKKNTDGVLGRPRGTDLLGPPYPLALN